MERKSIKGAYTNLCDGSIIPDCSLLSYEAETRKDAKESRKCLGDAVGAAEELTADLRPI